MYSEKHRVLEKNCIDLENRCNDLEISIIHIILFLFIYLKINNYKL
jgi:hypothetical protein